MSSRVNQISHHLDSKMAVVFNENVPDITLYTTQTPNGIKISITLEELGYSRLNSWANPKHLLMEYIVSIIKYIRSISPRETRNKIGS